MNGMIAWWASNKVAANLLMAGIIIMGILSFNRMEREVNITTPLPFFRVTVVWPGAAPQEMEEQIVIRLEEALNDLDGIDQIFSQAREGFGGVFVVADPSVDETRFLNDIKLRVDGISSLPRGIEPPKVEQLITRNELMRIVVSGNVSEMALKRAAEDIRDEVVLLPGAAITQLFGVRAEEVSIELSETAMRRYGLSFDEVSGAIRNSSINLSSGSVQTDTGDVLIRARNLANNQADFENIVVRQTPEGAFIRVGDVAKVIDGFEENEILATMNGEAAILVQIMTSEVSDVVKTSEAVLKWLEEASERQPEGIKLTLWEDTSKIYFDRVNTISSSALSGLLLVFLILILTIRPKVAFWVTFGIATAFAGAFIMLPGAGVSLNMLSLFAFLLVLGVVVDDAIVVGENIHTESSKPGADPLNAAILGTQLVAKPVIYAVLTTMITFAPWLFVDGVTATFTRQISIIVIASLSFSLIEALLILPAHLSTMKPRTKLGRFGKLQKGIANSIVSFAENKYRPFAQKVVARRYLTLSVFFVVFMLSIGLSSSGWIKFSFMPEIESEQIEFNVTLPEGTPYSRALEILAQLQEGEQALVDEVNVASGGEDKLIENWYTRSRRDSVLALVKLVPSEDRTMTTKEAAERLRELVGDIPDAEQIRVIYTQDRQDPGLQFRVSAPDFDELRAAVDDLENQLYSYDTLYDIRDDLLSSTDEIQMTLKPGAEQLGVTLGDVSRQVRQAYYGEEVQRLPRDGNDVRVMVKYPRSDRKTLESLEEFRLRLSDGREVPLMAVVDMEYSPSMKQINRRERQRSAVLSAELKDEVRDDIMKDLNENFFTDWEKRHPTATRGAIGQAEGEARFMSSLVGLYITALFAMYALIAVAFRSYFTPILVMVAIPFAYMGAIYGHALFGMNITLFTYFGVGAAAGVVVNDNLVLIDYLNRLRAKGIDPITAVVEAGVARFRPILLTTVTTFVGLMPMMLDRTTQAQFLQPTVIGLSFGVLFALFVTLLLVPAMFGIGVDIHARASGFKQRVKGIFRYIFKDKQVPEAGE
jgi:multidrug efflux pump subunit AcrB